MTSKVVRMVCAVLIVVLAAMLWVARPGFSRHELPSGSYLKAADGGPLVVWLHSNGSDGRQLVDTRPFLRDALLDAGYLVAESDACGSSWGSECGVSAYERLISEVQEREDVTGVYLAGSSMGGIMAAKLVSRVPVEAVALDSPVFDVAYQYETMPGHRYNIDKAGVEPGELLRIDGVPVRIWVGDADERVPPDRHALAVHPEHTTVIEGAGHFTSLLGFKADEVVEFFARPSSR